MFTYKRKWLTQEIFIQYKKQFRWSGVSGHAQSANVFILIYSWTNNGLREVINNFW